MKAQLYFNNSNRNVLDKEITTMGEEITIHFKEDTDIVNPTIYISREIDITDCNYIRVKGDIQRYYYFDSVETSQQYYIVKCHVDVLMSFYDSIVELECIVIRNSNQYNMYLNDDRLKLNNMSRVETLQFPSGFKVGDSKIANFVLTLNGGGGVSNNGGGE